MIEPVKGLLQKLRGDGAGSRGEAADDRVGAFVERFTLQGAARGPLTGLSFAAKDLFDVAGHVTGCGNPAWAASHAPAAEHAAAVAACLAAGATLHGKTHTDELAYSLMGANAHYGTPVNSAAPLRVPGGSSSGSAAAVAARLVDFSLGSDTGGSVRLPGAFCGLYGLRTTHGSVDGTGMVPLAPSFDVVGWFARSIWTLSAVAEVLQPRSRAAVESPRLLIAEDAWALAGTATAAALRPAAEWLQDILGAAKPLHLAEEPLAEWREVFRVCQAAEAWQTHGAWIAANTPDFGSGVAERFAAARRITAEEAAAARSARVQVRRRLGALLDDAAVVILPTAPGPAPLREADPQDLDAYRAAALALLCPAGLAGLPQLTLPVGQAEGAPVGLSLLGAPGSERTLLRIAERLELCTTMPFTGI